MRGEEVKNVIYTQKKQNHYCPQSLTVLGKKLLFSAISRCSRHEVTVFDKKVTDFRKQLLFSANSYCFRQTVTHILFSLVTVFGETARTDLDVNVVLFLTAGTVDRPLQG